MAAELPRLTHNNNLTTSQLVFAPKKEDQGRVLTCEAENEVFPKVNKSSELNVYFIPVLNLELEDTQIDPSYISEGDSITFKCLIQAHPWIWRIEWLKDGESLKPSDGVIIEEQRYETVQKFKTFSVTQILREIKFTNLQTNKSSVEKYKSTLKHGKFNIFNVKKTIY